MHYFLKNLTFVATRGFLSTIEHQLLIIGVHQFDSGGVHLWLNHAEWFSQSPGKK